MVKRSFAKGIVIAAFAMPALAHAGDTIDQSTVDLCSNNGQQAIAQGYRAQFSDKVQFDQSSGEAKSMVYVVPPGPPGQRYTTCAVTHSEARAWGDNYQNAFFQAQANADQDNGLRFAQSAANMDKASTAAKFFKSGHDGLPNAPRQAEKPICSTLFSVPANANVAVDFTGRTELRSTATGQGPEIVAVLSVKHDGNKIDECRVNGDQSAMLIARLGGASNLTLSNMDAYIHQRGFTPPATVPETIGEIRRQERETAQAMAQRTPGQQDQLIQSAHEVKLASEAIHFSSMGRSNTFMTTPNFGKLNH